MTPSRSSGRRALRLAAALASMVIRGVSYSSSGIDSNCEDM